MSSCEGSVNQLGVLAGVVAVTAAVCDGAEAATCAAGTEAAAGGGEICCAMVPGVTGTSGTDGGMLKTGGWPYTGPTGAGTGTVLDGGAGNTGL
jgi:hypothetical protein